MLFTFVDNDASAQHLSYQCAVNVCTAAPLEVVYSWSTSRCLVGHKGFRASISIKKTKTSADGMAEYINRIPMISIFFQHLQSMEPSLSASPPCCKQSYAHELYGLVPSNVS